MNFIYFHAISIILMMLNYCPVNLLKNRNPSFEDVHNIIEYRYVLFTVCCLINIYMYF